MANHYTTQGFIFRKDASGEADRIFVAFTRDFGKLQLFAKAIRKITSKLKGGIEIFCVSEFSFIQGKNRKTLTDANFIEKFTATDLSPEKLETAYRIAGLLENFVKGQEPDEKIWDALLDFFKKLSDSRPSRHHQQLLYYYFFWNFASLLGYRPEFSACALCTGRLEPFNLYFSSRHGGILCQICGANENNGQKISADAVKVIRLFLKNDWRVISKLKAEQILLEALEKISKDYENYLL